MAAEAPTGRPMQGDALRCVPLLHKAGREQGRPRSFEGTQTPAPARDQGGGGSADSPPIAWPFTTSAAFSRPTQMSPLPLKVARTPNRHAPGASAGVKDRFPGLVLDQQVHPRGAAVGSQEKDPLVGVARLEAQVLPLQGGRAGRRDRAVPFPADDVNEQFRLGGPRRRCAPPRPLATPGAAADRETPGEPAGGERGRRGHGGSQRRPGCRSQR